MAQARHTRSYRVVMNYQKVVSAIQSRLDPHLWVWFPFFTNSIHQRTPWVGCFGPANFEVLTFHVSKHTWVESCHPNSQCLNVRTEGREGNWASSLQSALRSCVQSKTLLRLSGTALRFQDTASALVSRSKFKAPVKWNPDFLQISLHHVQVTWQVL